MSNLVPSRIIDINTIRRPSQPHWICSQAKQILRLALDISWSMDESDKAPQVSAASQQFIQMLAEPINKDGFYVEIIHFGGHAVVAQPVVKATMLYTSLDPLVPGRLGAGTHIVDALVKANEAVAQAETHPPEAGVHWLRPVTMLMTDGQHNCDGDPLAEANILKRKSDLVTVAFGKDADEALLKQMATTSQHFYRCANGRELRGFLAAVGATLSQTRAARVNATVALTTLQPRG